MQPDAQTPAPAEPPLRQDDPSLMPADSVLQQARTDQTRGLDSAEAARRLAQDGPNALDTQAPVPGWRKFLRQFHDPLIYLLLAAIAITLGAWAIEGYAGWPVDAIVIAAVVLLNALIGYLQEAKAENAAAALARMTEVTAGVMRDGELMRVPSQQLVRGDILVLAEGDAIGADARLLQANALRVQEASLTGESEAVLKDAAVLQAPASLGDRLNMVYKGTAVAGGTGLAVVTATGMGTEMGAIAHMLAAEKEDDTPLQKEVRHIGRMLGIAVIVIAVAVIGTLLFVGHVHTLQGVVTALLFGVSLAVAAVPEGLPAILSLVLALGVQRMAEHKAIVKKLSSVETLGSASVICTDKTGTLTKSEMTVERVTSASGESHVTGVGYAPEGQVQHEGAELQQGPLHSEHRAILTGGSLASNATLRECEGNWEIQGDPTEAALLVAERKLGVDGARAERFERVAEIPFDSERKLMSVIVRDKQQQRTLLVTKGAPDVLLQRCTHVRVGDGVQALEDTHVEQAQRDIEAMSGDALRTLAVGYRVLPEDAPAQPTPELEHDLVLAGMVGIIDPPRPEAAQAIAEARAAGVRVIMITGDHPRTAQRIATDLGIIEAGDTVLTGDALDELLSLGDAALAKAVRSTSVYARVAPEHKLRIVEALQTDGHIVAMTGDGVNDAPALKSADIGVAMGVTGTEVTKEAARMILADDNFATIVQAVREGRGIFSNIRKFLRYLLSSNMGEVLTVFLGVIGAGVIGLTAADGHGPAGALVLPLLATQILWINLITDSAPALALGMDPPSANTMRRPPRKLGDRVIDGAMWSGVIQTGLVMALATLLTIDWFLPGGLLEGGQDLTTARTAGFTVLVLAQLFNCFNVRSEDSSAFRGLGSNPWLWGAVLLSVLLQVAVVHVSWLNTAFGTTPLTLAQWGWCAVMASTVLWHGELRKLVRGALRQRA